MKVHRFALLVALGFPGIVRAQASPLASPPPASATSTTFSLDQALAAMRRAHPLVHAASANIRAAEGDAVSARHWSNPSLDVTYYQAVRNSSYDPLGTPGIGITQFLDLAGVPAARGRSADAEVRATRAERDGVLLDLEWTVREAFVRLAISLEREKVHRDMVMDLERALAIVQARVSGGLSPRYDASRAKVALEQAHADLSDAQADVVRARGAFDVAVGPAATDLSGAPAFDPTDIAAGAVARDALPVERPEIAAARQRAQVAAQDVDVAKRSVFPGIGVRIGAGFGQATGQLDIGAGLVVPLPLLERGQGSVGAAQARAQRSRHVVDALTTASAQRLRAARAEYLKRVETLVRFRAQTAGASDGMRGEAEAGYREARLSVLELVDAYQSHRDVRLRSLELAEDAQIAYVDLGRAGGVPKR